MQLNDVKFYAPGRHELGRRLRRARRDNLRPPPKLSLSQWAREHAQLSRETSAQTGKFRAFPYQDGIMDAITDPTVEMISVMKGARVGYTKILDNMVGYYLHQDPSPIMIVQPRVEDAEDYSKTEIMPMLRDTPVLRALSADMKTKDGNNTILKKSFSNGASVSFVGANSPGGFRRITVRIAAFDEVDGYPIAGAGNEGDQVKLGSKRTESFWNRKIILGSTPTEKGISRIEKSFEESDQRYYYVPCPHCGVKQTLEWGGPDTPFGMKWRKDADGNSDSSTAFYLCKANGCVIEEVDKEDMLKAGEWVASKPFKGHAGFHISALYSLFVNAAWTILVKEWLECRNDPLLRKTFWNLVLGLPYEDNGEGSIKKEGLMARREIWEKIPSRVEFLTIGGDMQTYRGEFELVGWANGEESWSHRYKVIEGDPETDAFWQEVDAFLLKKWETEDGRTLQAASCCIDSGGNHTQRVYEFCKARLGRYVWAIKGESAIGGKRNPVWPTARPSKRKKNTYRPVIVGVNTAKDVTRTRLHIDFKRDAAGMPLFDAPNPGFMHFPMNNETHGDAYFAQLTSERLVTKETNGFRYRIWELPNGRANEASDCRNYAYAALCGLLQRGFAFGRRPPKMHNESRMSTPVGPTSTTPAPEPAATPQGQLDILKAAPSAPRGPSVTVTAGPAVRTGNPLVRRLA